MTYTFFDDEFLAPYKTREVPFGPLGYVTYKRTYARFIEAENRTEEWWETCARVLAGNFLLEWSHLGDKGVEEFDTDAEREFEINRQWENLQAEAQQAYDDMFHLRWLPPGRGLWCSGVPVSETNGATLTNCWYVNVEPKHGKVSYPFVFAMDMLMLGGGVGFGVSEAHIRQIPAVCNPVDLFVVCREDHRDYQFLDAQKIPYDRTHQYIVIKDSREGWTYGLKKTINAAFLSKRGTRKSIVIDVSEVRASGERIKGFGGKSSGPAPLVELLRGVNRVLNGRVGNQLTDVDCVDLMTMIGRCVVSGNVRRSAMIAVGDGGSQDFINMKNPQADEEGEYHNWAIQHHRWASNNSVLVDASFDPKALAESIWVKGEPGWFNLDLVQNYGRLIDGRQDGVDGHATGTNPCGEISLETYEPCNLAEIFPSNCEDFDALKRVAITAYRYAKRVTLSPYEWPESKEVVERNRRVGVSISGIQDWVLQLKNQLHPDYPLADVSTALATQLDTLYNLIKVEDGKYSASLGINRSIKLTTVKPSGTISLLAGVSPGIHYPYASHYIRRIQFQDTDPLVDYLRGCGFTVRKAATTPHAVVVEFPVKVSTADLVGFKSAGDVSAAEQLEMQRLLQTYWADNSVSCTISFQESDREVLPNLVAEYSLSLKSTSFLPYTPQIKEHYPDLPYEPITEETYQEMMSQVKAWPSRLQQDAKGLEILDIDECAGGACPIR